MERCIVCGGPDGIPWGSWKPSPACAPCHSAVVSKRRAELDALPTCLYRLFDVFGRLLYVGISSDLTRR